jgi:hypothetical protein
VTSHRGASLHLVHHAQVLVAFRQMVIATRTGRHVKILPLETAVPQPTSAVNLPITVLLVVMLHSAHVIQALDPSQPTAAAGKMGRPARAQLTAIAVVAMDFAEARKTTVLLAAKQHSVPALARTTSQWMALVEARMVESNPEDRRLETAAVVVDTVAKAVPSAIAGVRQNFGQCSAASESISTDGACGSNGKTCVGSTFRNCCSSGNFCGSSSTHCGVGCQNGSSSACLTSNIPSVDGSCGPKNGGLTCAGGAFDSMCCSSSGYCGTTSEHCSSSSGCQKGYGKCN